MSIMIGQNNVSDTTLGTNQVKSIFIGRQQLYPHAEYTLQEQAYIGLFSNMAQGQNLPDFSEDHVAQSAEEVRKQIAKYSSQVVQISNAKEPENPLTESQQLMMNALIDNLFGEGNEGGDDVPSTTPTIFTLDDGSVEEYEITGVLDSNWMVANGFKTTVNTNSWEKSIVKASIGTGVTAIGTSAFQACPSLGEITIPEGVTDIGMYAFASCSGLHNIVIPNSVKSIGRQAFSLCTSLQTIDLGNGLNTIGEYAFDRSGLTSIVIPDSVNSIGKNTFWQCGNLQSVVIGTGVRDLPEKMLCECRNLVEVTIPEGVETIGERAFNICTSLQNIVIPSSVTNIGTYAFLNCVELSNVTFVGKTLEEVENLGYVSGQARPYPWGISDTSIITVA